MTDTMTATKANGDRQVEDIFYEEVLEKEPV